MTPEEFPQFAELWQEQIEPQELAELQAMAKNIERDARRRWLFDLFLGIGLVGITCLALWIYPASLQTKSGFALLLAIALWAGWRRHQITRDARATAIDDPRLFFEKAIKNVRAEVNMSTLSLWLAVPGLIFCFYLMGALHGLDGIEFLLRKLRGENSWKTIAVFAALVPGGVYFIRDNLRLRERLRRLEAMSREWDEQQARDRREGP